VPAKVQVEEAIVEAVEERKEGYSVPMAVENDIRSLIQGLFPIYPAR
jgi:hypothetical protein